jgi:hypothetical protein
MYMRNSFLAAFYYYYNLIFLNSMLNSLSFDTHKPPVLGKKFDPHIVHDPEKRNLSYKVN